MHGRWRRRPQLLVSRGARWAADTRHIWEPTLKRGSRGVGPTRAQLTQRDAPNDCVWIPATAPVHLRRSTQLHGPMGTATGTATAPAAMVAGVPPRARGGGIMGSDAMRAGGSTTHCGSGRCQWMPALET
eukprot:CAMPEP_0171064402 /NCGR_PEP_ID=MMETSP0766_2-20121228/6265_1 /TAXON_ID=439317 /ORGANISM="Gambierdiscus australes, Strain CAWD 149" /LENGTH=129 /DNA_ID=CAMNT_0011520433 /DNA_START=32 /DNA_END=417 /DNA_ORIENTATION=+